MFRIPLSLLAMAFVLGCDTGTGPIRTSGTAQVLPFSDTTAFCNGFRDAHPANRSDSTEIRVTLPPEFDGKAGDFLVFRIYGIERNIADVPGCEVLSVKVTVPETESETAIAVFPILAKVNTKVRNFISVVGFRSGADPASNPAFDIDAPPEDYEPGLSQYRIEGLEPWVIVR
jgi:hypothetical protein